MPRPTSDEADKRNSRSKRYRLDSGNASDVDELLSRLRRLEAQIRQLQRVVNALASKAKWKSRRPSPEKRGPAFMALLEGLSPRERQVFDLFAERKTDRQMARALGTRLQTVRNQMANIGKKLGTTSRQQLMVLIMDARFLDQSIP